jgi:predicted CXXCH cytochrome family protein
MLKESIPALCYQCHPEEGKRFNRVHAHTPVQNGNCLGCHDAHGGNFKNLLLLPSEKLCSSCHLSMQKQLEGASEIKGTDFKEIKGTDFKFGLPFISLHPPFREGQCMQCHDPHATDYKNMLIRDNGQVCLSSQCHQPLVSALEVDRQSDVKIHAPVKDYQCMACHNPHGSRIPHQLLSQSATLCFPCHKGMEEKIKPATEKERPSPGTLPATGAHCPGERGKGEGTCNVHPPVREGKCLTCHSGQGAGYPSLLTRGVDSMCMECHGKDDKSFSLAHRRIEIKKEHCLECHDPHASEGKGLFRRVVHKPFQSKKCDVCHKNAK